MATSHVTKMTATRSPLTGHPPDSTIAASTDKGWQHRSIKAQLLEITGKYWEPPNVNN